MRIDFFMCVFFICYKYLDKYSIICDIDNIYLNKKYIFIYIMYKYGIYQHIVIK